MVAEFFVPLASDMDFAARMQTWINANTYLGRRPLLRWFAGHGAPLVKPLSKDSGMCI